MTNSFRLGGDGIYRCDGLQRFLWQEHGFGTRAGNPPVDITLKQIHSDRVVDAKDVRGDRSEEGDALITDCAGLAIGVRTADCVPLLMLDARTRTVAAVHAGWRGTAAFLVRRTLEQFAGKFGGQLEDLHVAIGPAIRACCYEVGTEVAQRFADQFPEWGAEDIAVRKLDLVEANVRQMKAAGVPAEQIFDSGLCTACMSEQFFSFRREPENPGRQLSAVKRLA